MRNKEVKYGSEMRISIGLRRVYGFFSLRRSALIWISLFLCFSFLSCRYSRPNLDDEGMSAGTRDSLTYLYDRHYTLNTNLEVVQDSVVLACLPVKDCYNTLYKGDRVVVAEFAIHPADSVDSVWVKLAHTQEIQGWIGEREMMQAFVPTDSISQFIYLFSDTHASYFVVIFALFVGAWMLRLFRRKQLKMVYFNDIDSIYPMLLCVLLAFAATLYGTMQSFIPDTWEHYYFNPTLNPFKLPPLLGMFITSIWLIIVVSLALLDDLFHQVSIANAFFYLLGLSAVCIFCYLFFIYTTSFYIGYLFLLLLVFLFVVRARRSIGLYTYRCGNCGAKLRNKGECPHCGAINK